MKLTKEQIKHIDNHLYKDGIKYWDLRIEMLDHIVSDIEENATTNDFKNELNKSLKRAKWSGNLENINRKGWQNVNKYYRKIYFQGFVNFFKNPKNLLIFVISMMCFFLISEKVTHKEFIKISYVLFALPLLMYFYLMFKTYRKKLGKSVHRDYGVNYLILSFLILNAIMQFVRLDDGFPLEYHKIILFIVVPAHLILTYSGYQVFKKAMNKVENMKRELSL